MVTCPFKIIYTHWYKLKELGWAFIKLKNYRMVEDERDLWRSFDSFRAALELIAQDHIQMAFECLQG